MALSPVPGTSGSIFQSHQKVTPEGPRQATGSGCAYRRCVETMSDEQEVAVAEESHPGKHANTPTLSVLLGAIESFHTRPRVARAGGSRSAEARAEAPVNISKQLEALHGDKDFSFA